jgi:hypothetical protein
MTSRNRSVFRWLVSSRQRIVRVIVVVLIGVSETNDSISVCSAISAVATRTVRKS